jgi:hypothetical protein
MYYECIEFASVARVYTVQGVYPSASSSLKCSGSSCFRIELLRSIPTKSMFLNTIPSRKVEETPKYESKKALQCDGIMV